MAVRVWIIAFYLTFVLQDSVSFVYYEESPSKTTFQRLRLDSETGHVFVAGKNTLSKLDESLNLLQQVSTGPANDNINCDPTVTPCIGANLEDNDASVLETDPYSGETRNLLFCGSLHQGLCSLYSMTNINDRQHLSPRNRVNYVGGKGSVVSFYGHWGSGDHKDILYVASTFDQRPINLSNDALSARKIQPLPDNSNQISYAYSDESSSTAINIDEYWRSSYLIKYVYGFEHGGFSYFLTIQREDTDRSAEYVTKLVRVCQNDTDFNSYSEISLNCMKKNGISTTYNIALAAYVATIGPDMATKFALSGEEMGLFVILGNSNMSSDKPNRNVGSGLCVYTMSQIRSYFKNIQRECYTGRGSILPWIQRFGPSCQRNIDIYVNIEDDFCGSPDNVGIGSRYPLTTETNLTTSFLASALAITVHNQATVAVIGTTDGKVLKMLLNGTDAPPYAVMDVGGGQQAPAVARDMLLDPDHTFLYAMTGSKITKIPVRSCSIYKDCGQCVTTGDPLRCGWCKNRCSTQEECVPGEWENDRCSPIIHSFHPKSGPSSGGTRVTIIGENFGRDSVRNPDPRNFASVEVALGNCAIEYHNSSYIVCLTQRTPLQQRTEIERDVKVRIVDPTKETVNFAIRGVATSQHVSFAFREPSLASFAPHVGPISGGTLVRIYGSNLNIGGELEVTVARQPCIPASVQDNLITCLTSPLPVGHVQRSIAETTNSPLSTASADGPVNITIDSTLLDFKGDKFQYKEDPEVYQVLRRKSIQSGGLPIQVEGKNLNIIERPLIQVTIARNNSVFSETCESDESGDWMICPSPNISTIPSHVDPDVPVQADINFAMDGVEGLLNFSERNPEYGHMMYMVDPEIYDFSEFDRIREFFMDENYLEVEGRYIDKAIDEEDVMMTIGGRKCNVTQLASTLIICHPEKPIDLLPQEPLQDVTVTIGNLMFHVGYLQFAKERSSIVIIAASGAGILAGIVVVVLFIFLTWQKLSNRGPCAKKYKTESHNESGVRYTEVSRTNGEPIYRINHAENSYWSDNIQGFTPQPTVDVTIGPLLNEEARRLIEDANLLIPREQLLLLEIIGQGHFGCVYKGVLKTENRKEEVDVAVKTLKSLTEGNLYASTYDARKFLDEALRMQEFNHPHILRLIGITLDKENLPLVVLPFMKHGDLLSYIRHEDNSPTVKELMEFGIQVAKGMAYLSALKFVHRDLAARNCMLDDDMQVKVADFGLSRDIYERDYYSSDDRKAKLPVKWMSLESLEKGIYNIKTDVWSYGVVLWELMTRGVSPYPDVDNWDIIKYLKCGRRMPQPAYCPDLLYSIMIQCWDTNPRMRPSFNDLVHDVCGVIESMELAHSPGVNTSYINVPLTQDYLYPLNEGPVTPDPAEEEIAKLVVRTSGSKCTMV